MFHRRPRELEYAPRLMRYVHRVPDGDIRTTLQDQGAATASFFKSLDAETLAGSYEAGKWTLHQVLEHMIELETVFARAGWAIAKGDVANPIATTIAASPTTARTLELGIREFEKTRAGTIAGLGAMGAPELLKRAEVDGTETTARSLFWIVAGHELHHTSFIADRYLCG